MRVWLVMMDPGYEGYPVGIVDDDYLPDVLERCKKCPDLEVDLDSPLSLNATGFLTNAEHRAAKLKVQG